MALDPVPETRDQFVQGALSMHAGDLDFRGLAENIPTLCWIAKEDGSIVWYNRRWYEYTGTTPEQMEGWGWQSVHDPQELPGVLDRWRASITSGAPFEMTFPLRGADGLFRPFLTRIVPARDAAGIVTAWYGVNTDISDQHNAESALSEARGFSATVLDASRDCIIVLDREGQTQFVNRGGIAGMEIDDVRSIIGLSWLRGWEGADLDAARAAIEAANAGSVGRFQGYSQTHKGNPRWWDVAISAIPGSDGIPQRLVSIGRDITEIKNAEKSVRESEQHFQSLAQSMPTHVWTAKPDGHLDWLNDRAYAYVGAEVGSLDGNAWERVVHPEDLPTAATAWAHALQTNEPYEVEFRLKHQDGSYRWYIGRAMPIRDAEGAVTRWIGANTDIDDQKTAETALYDLARTLEGRIAERSRELEVQGEQLRQSQKMEAVGQLTGGIAHDFNNLLQVISGNLQLLANDVAGNARAERRIANGLAGANRGAKLANQLLAFSRRQPLEPKVVNIGRFVAGTEEMIRRAIGEAIEVETIVSGGLWNSLIDPTQIENAILNLAINARDAMDGVGKLTIEVGNASLDENYASVNVDVRPGQYVMLAVTDTGSGMSPEVVSQVFEPFFTTKPEGKGTGLGLSMVYGFVKQSGGHVKIYSEVGHGTTIKLYLPRSSQTEDRVSVADTGLAVGGTETILVVEDDEQVRATVVEMLHELGYRVLKAKDAAGGLNVVESGVPIDVLFTDVVMPGPIKSTELARKAKLRLPTLAVLFTSGYTQNAIVHGGRLDPGVELLAKPYTREALARKIRHVLGGLEDAGRMACR